MMMPQQNAFADRLGIGGPPQTMQPIGGPAPYQPIGTMPAQPIGPAPSQPIWGHPNPVGPAPMQPIYGNPPAQGGPQPYRPMLGANGQLPSQSGTLANPIVQNILRQRLMMNQGGGY